MFLKVMQDIFWKQVVERVNTVVHLQRHVKVGRSWPRLVIKCASFLIIACPEVLHSIHTIAPCSLVTFIQVKLCKTS